MKKVRRFLLVALATLSVGAGVLGFSACSEPVPGLQGEKGDKGKDGKDGVSVLDVKITYGTNESGENVMVFTFYMSNGSTLVEEVVIGSATETPDSPEEEQKASEGLAYKLNADGETYSVTGIGACTDTEIVIPSTHGEKPVTAIGAQAFLGGASLTSVAISKGITTIGDWAFYECSNLKSVVISDSVVSISENAFEFCESLTNITVDEDNTMYKSVDGDLYTKDGGTLIQYAVGKKDTTFTVPSGVLLIGNCAFQRCSWLNSVVLPEGLIYIGNGAFDSCSKLTSITIPKSVTLINNGAFIGCTSLMNITLHADNIMYKTIDGNLYAKDGKTLLQYAIAKKDTIFTLPENVTSIGYGAFGGCNLKSIVIPKSITSIGMLAFWMSSDLTDVYYCGTEEDWKEIFIDMGNSELTEATRYYYSESKPTVEGNYWYYDENGEVAVW